MKDLNFLNNNIIAHRGYFDNSLGIPENSIPAFQRAIDFNYPIELDVHILKDNTVVVFHDDNLKRMTGLNKKISDCTYSKILVLNILNTNEKIPSLMEVLNLVNGKVPILIELKSDKRLNMLSKEVANLLRYYKGKYAIQSFSPSCIYYFKKNYPNIVRGQLAHNYKITKSPFLIRFLLNKMAFNFITKPDFISYGINSCDKNKIKKIKENKLVLGWTVKNGEQYNENKDIFNNLICENMQDFI